MSNEETGRLKIKNIDRTVGAGTGARYPARGREDSG